MGKLLSGILANIEYLIDFYHYPLNFSNRFMILWRPFTQSTCKLYKCWSSFAGIDEFSRYVRFVKHVLDKNIDICT